MKVYYFDNHINQDIPHFLVMAESKEKASEYIAKAFMDAFPDFKFKEFMEDCIQQRKNLIVKLIDEDLKKKYIVPLEKWEKYEGIHHLIEAEIQEFDENKVITL